MRVRIAAILRTGRLRPTMVTTLTARRRTTAIEAIRRHARTVLLRGVIQRLARLPPHTVRGAAVRTVAVAAVLMVVEVAATAVVVAITN